MKKPHVMALHGGLRKRFAVIGLTLCSLLIGQQNLSAKPDIIHGGGGNSCLLYAQSTNGSNPNFENTIYDDGPGNYYGGFSSFNCANHFLIREYVNTNINIGFSYDGVLDPSLGTPPVSSHHIVIKNLTTPTVPDIDITSWADANSDGSMHFYVFHPTVQGVYQIQYFRPGVTSAPDIMGIITAIRKITSLTLTLPPVCPRNLSQYNFQLTSTPAFSDLLYTSSAWAAHPGGSLDCADMCYAENFIDVDFSASQADGNPITVKKAWDFHVVPCLGSRTIVPGFQWTGTATTTDLTSYWIDNNDVNDYSQLAPFINPDDPNHEYGQPVTITVQVSDGISMIPATAVIPVNPIPTVDVDINTICAPGASGSTAPNPQYTATTSGPSPATYTWAALPHNNVTLDHTNVSNPIVQYINNPAFPSVADYTVSVIDGNGCTAQKHVQTKFITSGYDLASSDSRSDMYDEPNSQLATSGEWNFWSSPDLWNRTHNDGIVANQPPTFAPDPASTTTPVTGLNNYVYVKVKNIGCISSPSTVHTYGSPYLSVYWTIGGFGGAEDWPVDWTTSTIAGISGPVPQGQLIGSTNIPSLAAGTSTTIPFTWIPPNPQVYSTIYSTGVTGSPTRMDLCFLSRIVDYHNTTGLSPDPTYGMTYMEYTGDPNLNVKSNNNIVTTNTSVIYASHLKPQHHLLTVGNVSGLHDVISVQFANAGDVRSPFIKSNLSHFVSIKLLLGDLFDAWKLAGAKGKYTAINPLERSVTFDGSHMVQLDSIHIDSGVQYRIAMEVSMLPGTDGNAMKLESFFFRELVKDSVDSVVGSYKYDIEYQPQPKGVIAVTEISNGPSGDCEYAEMVAANCGSDASETVDLRGWIIDDNSGNFNTSGCSTGVGIAVGHYRLASDYVWSEVPVGSVLVMYNHDANCYNLSDTFRIDTTEAGLVYWIPIGGTTSAPYGIPHVERYGARPSASACSYCSPTGPTNYTTASAWGNTIGLNNAEDAFQVRCPGCNATYSGAPEFYHGVGYGPATGTAAFATITAGSNNLGGPVLTGTGTAYKFVFTGANKADLGNPSKWSKVAADAAGTPPTTLGSIPSAFMDSVKEHLLNLPCCGNVSARQASETVEAKNPTEIKVYPNPVNSTLYFEFPASGKVTIKLFDLSGRVMEQQVIENQGTSAAFNVKGYAPGLYIYQVSTGEKIESGKILVN